MNQTWENGKKNLVLGPILDHLAQSRAAISFFKNLAPSVTRYHGQLSCIISEKTNDPILRKLGDWRTDWQTDEQTDESYFIGRCQTDVERPINYISNLGLFAQKKCSTRSMFFGSLSAQ